MTLKTKIENQFQQGTLSFQDERHIFSALRLHPAERKTLRKTLDELESQGFLLKDSRGCYATPEQMGAFTGRIQGNERGFAFIIGDRSDGRKDYFVPRRSLAGALHKDLVLALPRPNTEDEAYVVKILERGMKTVVGTFEKDRRAGYVIPDDRRFDSDVYIPLHLCKDAKAGDKVVAEITSYPQGKMVGGRICEILGESGDFYTEELSIIRSYSLRESFPAEVEKQADAAAKQQIFQGARRDLRDLPTVTIDGEDTRDIDDAVSLTRKDGNYVLGVHIADVSHYVSYGSKTDREAYARGTSVYFPDRVLPMLPPSLSNGACSLNEGEDRYALSALMTFDGKGNKIKSELCESLIRSDRRMTYTAVTALLDGDKKAVAKYRDFARMLDDMRKLCLLLEERRNKAGAVTLDVKEAHISLNERGEIVIPDAERSISHRMIEQFMVAANETVAEFAEKKKIPCLYRVHERPSPEKISSFYSFLRDLGVRTSGIPDEIKPSDFQKILSGVENKPYASVVNRVMLRSMQKARYCEENLGHFGLASACYCHFTSPIRRYPDLFVHRALKLALNGEADRARATFTPVGHDAATDTSECERRADMAERDVDDLYKTVYMSQRIGEEYDAVISGVTNFGIFAELPNTIEGIIRTESLPADSYVLIEDKFTLKGIRHTFKIGQPVKIRVAGCDFGSMRVQFVLAETN